MMQHLKLSEPETVQVSSLVHKMLLQKTQKQQKPEFEMPAWLALYLQ